MELEVEGASCASPIRTRSTSASASETKLDLVQYYLSVADGIVRALRDWPTYLKRHPDGAATDPIYQKRVPEKRPEWIETVRVTFPPDVTPTRSA